MSNKNILTDYTEFTRSTAIYPQANTGDMAAVMACVLGLAEETGEVVGKLYKMGRDGWTVDYFKERVEPELGDVFWQLCRLCDELGFNPASIILKNKDKLIERSNKNLIKGEGDDR